MVQQCKSEEYRQSPHAGSWYPGEADTLKKQIQNFLDNARVKVAGEIFGLVSPHAGYIYSGPIAAFAFKTVQNKKYDAVIVIGPSHHVGFNGASVDTLKGRITPLGPVDFDIELAKKIVKNNKLLVYKESAHIEEHSVEIQVPFIQTVLKNTNIVEIVMGNQDYKTCEMLSNAIYEAGKGKKVLVIASSDLSHFHSQETAEKLDQLVVESVSAFDPEELYSRLSKDSCEACGGGPIITAMLVAKKMGAVNSKSLVYATSGNTSGNYSQVVGYLAAAFFKKETDHDQVGIEMGLSEEEKRQLKKIAKESIEVAVRGKKSPEYKNLSDNLNAKYGAFVTITKFGNLRGCIGHIIGDQPLYKSVIEMAKAAALQDPRFPPVTEKELADLEIEISVLTPIEPVENFSDIVIGRDGLIIKRGYNQGLLLPQVASEYGWSVEEFLEETCHKAGLPADAYKLEDTQVFKFSAEVF